MGYSRYQGRRSGSGLPSPPWLLEVVVVVVVLLGAVGVPPASAHPLCRFWQGPYFPDPGEVHDFCPKYATFTCCSPQQERTLEETYNATLSRLPPVLGTNCTARMKDILCLQCSPYWAHTFNFEGGNLLTFPGLCRNFCLDFLFECPDALLELLQGQDVLLDAARNATRALTVTNLTPSRRAGESFCSLLTIGDPDYCYPAVEPLNRGAHENRFINDTQTGSTGCLCLEQFADQLRNPLVFRVVPDGSGRIAVGEQRGVVYLLDANGTRLGVFLDLQNETLVSSRRSDERGFLGMAFHPNFTENRRFFVYHTSLTPEGRMSSLLVEFLTEEGDLSKVNHTSAREILVVGQPFSNHNGGEIFFGIDGYLYLTLGDGGGAGDTLQNAQNKSTLLGSMIRIDVDNIPQGKMYGIPADNPFVNETDSRPELYAYGLRNPWRCDQDEGDPETGYGRGRIICGDVGQSRFEEIDIIEKGGNYGWNSREGFECFNNNTCGMIGDEILPIHAYPHSVGKSVTGGATYRGCRNPSLNGRFIFADFFFGGIFQLVEKMDQGNTTWEREQLFMCSNKICKDGLINVYERHILSFGEDADGEIYMMTTGNPVSNRPVGKIYRIVDPHRRGDLTKCRTYVSPPPPDGETTPSDPGSGSSISRHTWPVLFLNIIIFVLITGRH